MNGLRAARQVGRISTVAVLAFLLMIGSAMAMGGPGGGGGGGGGGNGGGGGGTGGGGGPVASNPLVGQWTAFIPGTTLEFFYTFTADFQFKFSKRDVVTGSFLNVEGIYTFVPPTATSPGEIVMRLSPADTGAFFDDLVFIQPTGQIIFQDSFFGTIALMKH